MFENRIKNIKDDKKKATALALVVATSLSLSGCLEAEMAPEEEYNSVVKMTNENGETHLSLPLTLDVPGEDFKLKVVYSCDDDSKREWRITSDKFLYLQVNTEGLKDKEVYIDNIHIDTSIKSAYTVYDGILQDTMDDHIHSSSLIGFGIDDDTPYIGVNAIEGSNNEFIDSVNAAYYFHERRCRETENFYKEHEIYANKISVVYDLLIKNPDEEFFHNVSVHDEFLVPITYANDMVKSLK